MADDKPKRELVITEDVPGRKKGDVVAEDDPDFDALAFTGKARWVSAEPEPGAGSLPF